MSYYRCVNPYCCRPTESGGTFCSRRCREDSRLTLARQAKNRVCIDCGGESFGGGLFCLPCWRADDRTSPTKAAIRRLATWQAA